MKRDIIKIEAKRNYDKSKESSLSYHLLKIGSYLTDGFRNAASQIHWHLSNFCLWCFDSIIIEQSNCFHSLILDGVNLVAKYIKPFITFIKDFIVHRYELESLKLTVVPKH